MWIKICANTSLEDALLAADLGADAIGFVFAPSPRQVTAAQVAAIVPHLPASVEKIGVFSSTDPDEIVKTADEAGLTGVQLHGGFDEQLIRRLHASFAGRVAIIPVLHWVLGQDKKSASQITSNLSVIASYGIIERVLVDAKTEKANGGTGLSYDWGAAREVFRQAYFTKVIAAGGLDPDNVSRAITESNSWGVDVASGVEASKGHKDPMKLKKFVEAVRKTEERN